MSWTIKINSGTARTPEQLGILEDTLSDSRQSQSVDQLTFSTVADYDSAPFMGYGDTFQLYWNSVKIFEGLCISNPRLGSAESEGIDYVVAGPWHYLETTAYTQPFSAEFTPSLDGDGEPIRNPDGSLSGTTELIYTPNVILYQDRSGNDVNTAEQLAEVINYASSVCGLPLTVGQLPSSPVVPWTATFQDATISQIIQSILKWHPDAVTWFDYRTSPPTLNVTTRADAIGLNYNLEDNNVTDFSIVPRNDIRPTAVAIHYRRTDQEDGESFNRRTVDVFPVGADFKAQGVLNVSIDLRGSNVQRQWQSIRTIKIPGGEEANDIGQRVWWRKKYPRLARDPFDDAESFTIENFSVDFATDVDLEEEPEPENPLRQEARTLKQADEVSDYPRELLEGSIDDWMGELSNPIRARELVVTARCYVDSSVYNTLSKADKNLFPNNDEGRYFAELSCTIVGTNARTKNYSRISNYERAERQPSGLAERLYSDLSQLQYEGSMSVVFDDVGTGLVIGRKLNFIGGRSEWASMGTTIQSISRDYSTGQSSLTFGPPEQLAPQDMIELLNYGRDLKYTFITENDDAIEQQSEHKTMGVYQPPKQDTQWFSGGGETVLPWSVAVSQIDGIWTAIVTPGVLYTALNQTSSIAIETNNYDAETGTYRMEVEAGDVVQLTFVYVGTNWYVGKTNAFSATTESGVPAEVSQTHLPLATIYADGDDLAVNQLTTSHLARGSICNNGESIITAIPI